MLGVTPPPATVKRKGDAAPGALPAPGVVPLAPPVPARRKGEDTLLGVAPPAPLAARRNGDGALGVAPPPPPPAGTCRISSDARATCLLLSVAASMRSASEAACASSAALRDAMASKTSALSALRSARAFAWPAASRRRPSRARVRASFDKDSTACANAASLSPLFSSVTSSRCLRANGNFSSEPLLREGALAFVAATGPFAFAFDFHAPPLMGSSGGGGSDDASGSGRTNSGLEADMASSACRGPGSGEAASLAEAAAEASARLSRTFRNRAVRCRKQRTSKRNGPASARRWL
mmetsp:Transcript_95854/g.310693  ORF Transcript_95854/g.310693 Transcript_95854/m.310693 type:complete len:294 (-) Transcript_95854:251-1132(-)